ncbi:MAG TPA: TetR/AcrR family transcriptional regulator [Limnobacter sp.]|nr:TetR/AcrR family transcriptional regulator [Limnobacter sp.]
MTNTAQASGLSRAQRQKAQLRAEIIEAAFEEFSERGYHQTAIADIAQRLGIGHGTFYRHFENKRDILEHVLDAAIADLTTALRDDFSPEKVNSLAEYKTQLASILKKLYAFAQSNPRALRLMLMEATSIDEEMTKRIAAIHRDGQRVASEYLQHGKRKGFFRSNLDTKATATAVVGMLMAGSMQYLFQPEDKSFQKDFGKAVIDLLTAGLAAQPDRCAVNSGEAD